MKVLLINKFHYKKGGAETYYFELAKLLQKAGHKVIFFSMQSKKNEKCAYDKYFVSNKEYVEKTSFVDKIKAAKTIVYSKEAYFKISELIKKEKPDLAILNNIHRQLTTSIIDALYENNVKIYWVVHDLILLCPNYTMLDSHFQICEKCCNGNYFKCVEKKCIKNSYLKSFLAYREAKFNRKRNLINKISMFITPSIFYKDKLLEYGFNSSKVRYIPNPISVPDTINIFKGDYCLYFGRLSREKGIDDLIRACGATGTKLLILGTGPFEDELKDLVKEANYDNIVFGGFCSGDKLTTAIQKSFFVVLPSKWYENCPYSAIEAMILGKPLIVSNNGGLPELVNNGYNGFIFNDIDELVNILSSIKKDLNYNDLCQNSYKKADELFNENKYLDRLFSK